MAGAAAPAPQRNEGVNDTGARSSGRWREQVRAFGTISSDRHALKHALTKLWAKSTTSDFTFYLEPAVSRRTGPSRPEGNSGSFGLNVMFVWKAWTKAGTTAETAEIAEERGVATSASSAVSAVPL